MLFRQLKVTVLDRNGSLHRTAIAAVAVCSMLLSSAVVNAVELQTYWTTNPNVAKLIPKADGSNGWNKWSPTDPIIVPGGPRHNDRFVWIAWRNQTNASKNKYFHFEISTQTGESYSIDEVNGFLGDDDDFDVNIVQGLSKRLGNPQSREYRFTPQPKWERVKIDNNEAGTNPWLLQAKAWSKCANVKPDTIRTVSIEGGTFGAPGAMLGNPRVTELVFFPWYSPIDTNLPPTFVADPQTGNWSFDFVNVDPFGNFRPEGGVRFRSDGQGLLTGDEYDAVLELIHDTSGAMSMFCFDAESNTYFPFDLMEFGPPMIEPFDIYSPGQGIIGWRAWDGFNGNQNSDAQISPQIFMSPPFSLEIQQNANVVRPFLGVTQGQWLFSTWSFIPGGYQGNGELILFDEYQHDGLQHPGLIIQFDSNSQQGMFFCGQPNPIPVPYIVDQWVPIDVFVDLDNDHCEVFYNQQPICQYQWTAGAFGDGAGLRNIAAVDLFANQSAPMFYDDLLLIPVEPTSLPPQCGTLIEGFGEINDFTATIGSDDNYWGAHGAAFAFSINDPVVQFELCTKTSNVNPNSISIQVEASKEANTANLILTAQLFNWTTGQFEVGSLPGTMVLTTVDTKVRFDLAGLPEDYLGPPDPNGLAEILLQLRTIQANGPANVRTLIDDLQFFIE